MKKILLFIFLFSGFIFGQNELIRRIEFKDSLSNHHTKTQVNTLLAKKLNIADSLSYVTPTQLFAYEPLLPATPENPATKFLDGNRTWATISIGAGGFAGNLYFTTEASDVSGYKKISYVNEVTETELSGTLTNQEVLIRTYLYDYGLATTVIDAGVWIANYRAKVSGTQGDTQLKIEIFLRHADNSETTLWSDYSPILDNTSYATIRSESNQPAFSCVTTDRLGARIYAKVTAANPITVYTIVGDGDASYFTTPLRIRHNQLRDLNGDSLFLHVTNTDTAKWNDKYTKHVADSLFALKMNIADSNKQKGYASYNKLITEYTTSAGLTTLLGAKLDTASAGYLKRLQWDLAYTNNHTHSNKAILDSTTTAFTLSLLGKINTTYGWGNHANAGYLTSSSTTATPQFSQLGLGRAISASWSLALQSGMTTKSGTYIDWEGGNARIRENSYALEFLTYNGSSLTTKLTISGTGLFTFFDGGTWNLGTTTGTKIGTATNQKIGFFNSTPIVQPSGNVLTALSNLGLVATPTLAISDVTNLTTSLSAKVAIADSNTFSGYIKRTYLNTLLSSYVSKSDSNSWTGYLTKKYFLDNSGGVDTAIVATRYWANNTFAPINLTASSIGISKLGTPAYTTAQDYINTTLSAGKISGGELTAVDSLHISVAAGKGFIKTTNSSVGSTVSFDWTANTNLLVTAGSVNYIYIDYNSGTPIISATTTESNINRNTQIPIGACYTDGHETPHVYTDGILLSNWLTNEQRRLLEVRRAEHASGAIVSETGTRNISITDGVFYIAGTRATFSAFNSSGAGRFKYVYSNGSGGWTYVSAQSQINNTNYDNGTGSLGTLTVNKYGVHWVFILTDGEIYIKYGIGDYTLAQAQAAQIPASLPTELTSFGVIAAKIIIQKSAAAFNSVISAYTTPFGTQSPSTHNDLAGLQGGTSNEYYHLTNAKYVKLDSLTARAYDLNLVTPTFISNSHTHANKAKLDSLNGSASKLNRIGNLTDGNGVLTNTSGTLSWSASSGGGCLMGTNASAVTTTSSSYVDASGYSVTLEANTTYFFSGSLYYGDSTNVTQAQFVYPDGTTAYGWVQYEDENGVGGHPMADIFTQLASIAPTTNYYEKVNFSGKLVTSSTAGDLKLQIKRTSGTGNATLSSLSSFALIKKN